MDMNMQAVVWLILLVVLLIIEAITLGLTTIWFAGGALAAFAASVTGMTLIVQIVVFIAISVLLLVITRPMAVRWMSKGRIRTNAGSLIGEKAIVTETISNLENKGQAQVRGQMWTARTAKDEEIIEKGRTVVIKEISGVKLIVKEEKHDVKQ